MMRDEFVQLLKRPFIQQNLNPLARAELSFLMLPLAPLRASASLGLRVPPLQFLQMVVLLHRFSHSLNQSRKNEMR